MRSLEFVVGCVGVALVALGLAMASVPSGSTAVLAQTTIAAAGPVGSAPVPDKAKRTSNPVPATADSVAEGKTIFSSQCTMCHGVLGSGKGDLVERLELQMPDFTDPAYQRARTDGELFWVIRNGHEEMPSQAKRFDDRTWWNVVNYIRTLERKD